MKRLVIDVQKTLAQASRSPARVMNSSESLVARVRQGDDAAFRIIFERYARPLVSFIYDQTGERGLAEELTQETFVRAHRNINRLRDDTRLSTWLFGIAQNVVREAQRSRRRKEKEVELEASNVSLYDNQLSPDEQLLSKEFDNRIREALQSLDADKRLVFTLKVIHERSYEEIAEITGFSVGKVKTDLHRARIEMRRVMRSYLGTKDEV